VRYEAKAIGAGSEGAQTQLQETYSKSMTLKEAETLALNTLKQVCVLSLVVSACNIPCVVIFLLAIIEAGRATVSSAAACHPVGRQVRDLVVQELMPRPNAHKSN